MGCPPDFDFGWSLDSIYQPLATGVEIVVVIDSIDAPSNSIIVSGNPVAVGDTIRFDTANFIPVYMFAGGQIGFTYRAIGTPTVVGEPVPCQFELAVTLAFCQNSVLLWGFDNPSGPCDVQTANSIEEARINSWTVGPVPAEGFLRVQHQDGYTQWQELQLLDLQGKVVASWQEGETPLIDGFSGGLYFLRIESEHAVHLERILIKD